MERGARGKQGDGERTRADGSRPANASYLSRARPAAARSCSPRAAPAAEVQRVGGNLRRQWGNDGPHRPHCEPAQPPPPPNRTSMLPLPSAVEPDASSPHCLATCVSRIHRIQPAPTYRACPSARPRLERAPYGPPSATCGGPG